MSPETHFFTQTAVLLLRPRSFFGANVVNIPAIFFTKNHLHSKQLIVFSDVHLDHFYQQIPWVNQHYDSQSFFRIWKQIPKECSLLYSMRPSMDGAPFFKWKGIHTVIGLDLRSKVLNHLFDFHQPCSITEYRAISHLKPLLSYSKADKPAAYYLRESMLALAGCQAQPDYSICFMPGAGGGEHKKWGIQHFFALALALQQRYPTLLFHFILGNSEKAEKEFLLQQRNSPLKFDIQENLKLNDLTRLVENSLLTVANDCGPSHISQCLCKPFIGLYQEPNPEWFHAHSNSICLSPSDQNIRSIRVEKVLESCLRLLKPLHH